MKSFFNHGLLILLIILEGNVSKSQTITTYAGNGTASFGGDGGAATSAQLNKVFGVGFDASGNLFIADNVNNRIRKVTPGGIISTFAGTGVAGAGGDGGPATSAQLNNSCELAVDTAGNVYVSDAGNHKIRKITPGGIITTFAGTGVGGYGGDGGPATSAQLNNPAGVAFDGAGNVYICDYNNHRIRKVTPAGIITTVAGNGTAGYSGDGGPATSAQLNLPAGIECSATGTLYISDHLNARVRKVTPGGIITTIAGTGVAGYSGDGGPATSAQINLSNGVALDDAGNIYISERNGHRIRKIDQGGIISTYAGTGVAGFSGDGGIPTSAQLFSPNAEVAFDAIGNVYIADRDNNRVRKVTCVQPSLTVSGNSIICSGNNTSLTASGANSYTWTGGISNGVLFTPTVSGSYTVTGMLLSGCKNTATFSITISPSPTVSAVSNNTLLCQGQSATLTASGASNYTWLPSGTGASIVISPTTNTTYTVTGNNINGCTNSASITQSVSSCLGLRDFNVSESNKLTVYPNPSSGSIEISSDKIGQALEVYNFKGELVYHSTIEKTKIFINIESFAPGIYIIRSGLDQFRLIKN